MPASSLATLGGKEQQGAEGPVPKAAADLAPAGPAAETHAPAATGKAAEGSKVAQSGLDAVVADHDIIRLVMVKILEEGLTPHTKAVCERHAV